LLVRFAQSLRSKLAIAKRCCEAQIACQELYLLFGCHPIFCLAVILFCVVQ
jgi:hypothetical protein